MNKPKLNINETNEMTGFRLDDKNVTGEVLKQTVTEVYAIPLTKGFRIEIEHADGSREVIKKKSTRRPVMVQLHNATVNGNASTPTARFFTFSKTIESYNREHHLKSFVVENEKTAIESLISK